MKTNLVHRSMFDQVAEERDEARARVAALESREQRIREAIFHPLFNSLEKAATVATILNLVPEA